MTAHIVCSPGEYQNNTGQTDCIDCPAGYECSDPTSLPVECGPGLYAPAQSTNCTQCPTGQSYISVCICGPPVYCVCMLCETLSTMFAAILTV